jgi:hypothetical protein
MAVIGNLIKTALEINQQFRSLPEDAEATQLSQLQQLLQQAADTSLGIYYGFEQVLGAGDTISAYQAAVPIFDYATMHERWWQQQQRVPNVSWPGQPQYFALSSGTTGKASKRIPVTEAMLTSFRRVGQSQIAALANFDLPADFFEKDVLMLSSSAHLTPHRQHLEGEISGINSANIPGWFDRFYKPGHDIARIDKWEDRVQAIARAAPEWDVVAICGIPSWVRMMLLKIMEMHQLEHINQLWPNLSIYASGGVAFAPHRKNFEALIDRPLTVMDTYLASEGFFAFTARPDTLAMQLAIDHGIFYEFIPFDERGFDATGELLENPEVLHLGQVEEGQEYALLISTPAGTWRYLIGDTIRFTDLSRYEMVISGRTKYFLNVVGSQLSEEKLNRAVQELGDELAINVSEFAVAAVQEEGEYLHQWILGTEDRVDTTQAAKALDHHLQELNKNYRVARQKALRTVRVQTATPQQLYDWLEQCKEKKGGQLKLPKVMPARTMEGVLQFLNA